MKFTDRQSGMDQDISRQDVPNSVSIAIGASMFPGLASAQDGSDPGIPGYCPPEDTDKRDSLATSFEAFERNIRNRLSRILGPGGFNTARDIVPIAVNRWPHRYAYDCDTESGRVAFEPTSWPENKRSWVTGSRPFDNIGKASTVAASNAMTEAAIEEAFSAVNELI